MKAILATPFIPISKNISSHRAAQGIIYADQLKSAGKDIFVNMTMELYEPDFNKFDELYIYHGNDWGGTLNLFGGIENFPHIYNIVNFSKFKGKVYSLVIDCPNYAEQLMSKIDLRKNTNKSVPEIWNEVDWENLKRIEREAVTIDPNFVGNNHSIATGDSHVISLYRPGWYMNSVPFKTLHGALEIGLKKFVWFNDKLQKAKDVDLYFGNIDIRHHLMRQDNPEQATRDLVKRYFEQADEIENEIKGSVTIYEPLPIEDISRAIPKSGWYKGEKYFGTWHERNNIRNIFIDEAKKQANAYVKFFQWTKPLMNQMGELDFKAMETPKSVHLSRAFYPHWQGESWNPNIQPKSKSNLEEFL